MAMPSTATCRLSCASTSATETLNPLRRRSLMLLRTCLLSFKLRDSRRRRRTRSEPTTIGRRSLLQRALDLLHAVRLDHVADLDVVVAGNLEAALEPLAHVPHVVLEALQRLQAGGAVGR